MKTAFVTGANGFIGSHLVEHLIKKGYHVKAFAQYNINSEAGWLDTLDSKILKNIEVIYGDIRDPFFLIKHTKKVDFLFNLAALISIPYSYESPVEYINTNVLGTLNCLEAVKKNELSQMIQVSTSEVYGTAKFKPMTEQHPLNAQSPYAASKIGADQLSLSYFKSFNLPVTIIRPFNTFGPRQSLRAVLPNIFLKVANNYKKVINVKLGNIYSKRDFTYVSDTVEGFIKAINIKKSYGEVINLGTGICYSIKDVLNIIENIKGIKIRVNVDKSRFRPKKSEVNLLVSDNTKARKLLKWKPKYSGDEGFKKAIIETIRWYETQNFENKNINIYHK